MNRRRFLGDRSIGEVGLGCWQLGGEWGSISNQQADLILEQAFQSGIDLYDTADVYGQGKSELRIGSFVQKNMEECTIVTKLGRLHGYPDGYSYSIFRTSILDSIKRLGVNVLDLVGD